LSLKDLQNFTTRDNDLHDFKTYHHLFLDKPTHINFLIQKSLGIKKPLIKGFSIFSIFAYEPQPTQSILVSIGFVPDTFISRL
jgi:hypothetical protein